MNRCTKNPLEEFDGYISISSPELSAQQACWWPSVHDIERSSQWDDASEEIPDLGSTRKKYDDNIQRYNMCFFS